jgi:ATP-dependent Clp protease adaptor protein ClpS
MSRTATRRGTQPAADTLYDEAPQTPRLYRVLLHNDDYTTMEFVVIILMEVFRKTGDEATAIMLAVHTRGKGECGLYPLEIAETKVAEVRRRAREADFPLRCTLEEA